jgi:hypothetical protein
MPNPLQSALNKVGSAVKFAGDLKKVADSAKNFVDDPLGFMKQVRSVNLPANAMPTFKHNSEAIVKSTRGSEDWRVSLSVPKIIQELNSPLLSPLMRTGKKLVFPFTPSIVFQHSANYNSLQPVHSNYPLYNYTASSVDAITISADFLIETSQDAEYWIGALTYLRSMTKMFYGTGPNAGNPPPICKLNGYGDYVFNDVPCLITSFNVDLPQDVDYIKTDIGSNGDRTYTTDFDPNIEPDNVSGSSSWVPAQSIISVTVQPNYSRTRISQFNMQDFVSGKLISNGKGFI